MSCVNCNNNQATTNTNYLPDPCTTGCFSITTGNCVTYSGATTACLGVTSGTKLDDIVSAIDQAICLLSEDRFGDYDLFCLNQFGIESEEQFAEKISEVLCAILGDELPTNPTSLSTLKVQLEAVQLVLNSQEMTTCFQLLSGVTSQINVSSFIQAIQAVVCGLDVRLQAAEALSGQVYKVKVSADDTFANYLENKVIAGDMIDVDVINNGANEQLRIRFDYDEFIQYLIDNPGEVNDLLSILGLPTTTTTSTTTTTTTVATTSTTTTTTTV